jgi:hypothetical protein
MMGNSLSQLRYPSFSFRKMGKEDIVGTQVCLCLVLILSVFGPISFILVVTRPSHEDSHHHHHHKSHQDTQKQAHPLPNGGKVKPTAASTLGSWVTVPTTPNSGHGFSSPVLMTDGSLMILEAPFTRTVWKLTPDSSGRYESGIWSKLAPLPPIPADNGCEVQYHARPAAGAPNAPYYQPRYVAPALLADGRVIFCGGEDFGFGKQASEADIKSVHSNFCTIYDPFADAWIPICPPPFIIEQFPVRAAFAPNCISDASALILPDGTYLLAPKGTNQIALLDPVTLEWTESGGTDGGTIPFPGMNNEQNLALLPNGKVLTTQCYKGNSQVPEFYGPPPAPNDMTSALLWNPATGLWTEVGPIPVPLTENTQFEGGPAVLRPDGKVVLFSANLLGKNIMYNSATGAWSNTTAFPLDKNNANKQLAAPDCMAAVLPNGNIFLVAGSFVDNPLTLNIFEFTYAANQMIQQPDPQTKSFVGANLHIALLPTGQVFAVHIFGNTKSYVYTPGDSSYNPAWAPSISTSPSSVVRGTTDYPISGLLFNGMTMGTVGGDDQGAASNFPLVRITHTATGRVRYCRTHNHSYMGVAAVALPVNTRFDVPSDITPGSSRIEIVANGIPSASKPILVI